MPTGQHVSLEPLPLLANDGRDADLFASRARLSDVNLEDGSEVFTRVEARKNLQERLMRVWAERGDYSQLTEESIRNPPPGEVDETDARDEDPRPSGDDMRKLVEGMLTNLNVARGELSTALDLLNVLSPATDPPNVDPNTIPLPHETLTLIPTATPAPPSMSDPTENPLAVLPLAESLEALKSGANSFFQASEDLIPLEEDELAALELQIQRKQQAAGQGSSNEPGEKQRQESEERRRTRRRTTTKHPDPWPAVLRIHGTPSLSNRTLLPLGALPGATLTGKGEVRQARQVGVSFGCVESGRGYRRAAVARIGELVDENVEKEGGRRLVVEFRGREDAFEKFVWDDESIAPTESTDASSDGVEGILRRRGRSAFAEELFAKLVTETRTDISINAEHRDGNRSKGEQIEMKGTNWTLRISLVSPSILRSSSRSSTAKSASPGCLVSPLLRLLFLQEYSMRRSRSHPPTSRAQKTSDSGSSTTSEPCSLLATVSTFLHYVDRVESLKAILKRLVLPTANEHSTEKDKRDVQVELWSGGHRLEVGLADKEGEEDGIPQWIGVLREILNGAEDLGGRATIRIGKAHIFHIAYSLALPSSPSQPSNALNAGKPGSTLSLRCPGKASIAIHNMRQLEGFLSSEVERLQGAEMGKRRT